MTIDDKLWDILPSRGRLSLLWFQAGANAWIVQWYQCIKLLGSFKLASWMFFLRHHCIQNLKRNLLRAGALPSTIWGGTAAIFNVSEWYSPVVAIPQRQPPNHQYFWNYG